MVIVWSLSNSLSLALTRRYSFSMSLMVSTSIRRLVDPVGRREGGREGGKKFRNEERSNVEREGRKKKVKKRGGVRVRDYRGGGASINRLHYIQSPNHSIYLAQRDEFSFVWKPFFSQEEQPATMFTIVNKTMHCIYMTNTYTIYMYVQ